MINEASREGKVQHWYAVNVRTGFAHFVAAELRNQGVRVFLPENRAFQPSFAVSGQISTASYVFARFSLEDSETVTILPGVLSIAGAPKPVSIDDKDISDLRAAMSAGLSMTVQTGANELQPGRVIGGPLSGRSGNFLELGGVWHFAIRVPALERMFLFVVPTQFVNVAGFRQAF